MKTVKILLCCLIISSFALSGFSQNNTAGLYSENGMRTAEEGLAAQEFRRGVLAYYRGSYNDAIMEFEKSLSYLPEDNLILVWLGKAYFRAGLEGNAIESWTTASNNGYGGLILKNLIESVRERRIRENITGNNVRLTEAGSFSGFYQENFIFSQPVSCLPVNDGTVWVLAYGSNELVRINVNGSVIKRIKGPVNGFDRPIDVIRLKDGRLIVSEVCGNRLSVLSSDGSFEGYYGTKGRGQAQFSGPQYLAQDSRENILVSDYGNKRVVVLDKDGNGLFYFGSKQSKFEGLKGPTGIAVYEDTIYVADEIDGTIYEFDLSGNYKGYLLEKGTLHKPESIKLWNGYLVVCDSNKVFSVDASSGVMYENVRTGNAPSKLTSAVPDVNGNVIVTDFVTNEVYVMAKMQEVIGGLFVQIERVNAENFPQVSVEVKVENQNRKPVVGLTEQNFYLTEGKRPVSGQRYSGAWSNLDYCDVTLVIDRRREMKAYENQVTSVVREIAASMNNKGTLRIVSASSIPAAEYKGQPDGELNFSASALKSAYSMNVPLDLTLRLSCNELINGQRKRAIIFITDGKTDSSSFQKYSLNEISSYMCNNSVLFTTVLLSHGGLDESLEYLVKATGGSEYYMYRPEGLGSIVKEIIEKPNGMYQLTYTSTMSTNFGEKYLPAEIEVYLMNRSGRDETGYFAPLE